MYYKTLPVLLITPTVFGALHSVPSRRRDPAIPVQLLREGRLAIYTALLFSGQVRPWMVYDQHFN